MRRLPALIAVACLLLTACSHRQKPLSKSGFALDTAITITLYDQADISLLEDCFERIRTYESLFSRTKADSDIGRLNAAGGETVTVSADTASLLRLGLHFSKLTGGAFDVTIAPVSDLWDFSAKKPAVPDQEDLTAAAAAVGYAGLSVTENSARLASPEMAVDLGGIAKGYIADRLAAYLREAGVGSALLNLGGNIYALGQKEGTDWTIGIQDPDDPGEIAATLAVSDCAVITSGSYERCFEQDGVRYHHILDPATGWPVQNGLVSVTVVSKEAAKGDALSTACFVLGKDRGLELIESLDGVEALFIEENGRVIASSGLSYREK